MFNVVKEDAEDEERETIETFIAYNTNKKSKWLYNGETYTGKGLVFAIVKEQIEKGTPVEKLAEFKMHSSPLVIEDGANNIKYGSLDVNGKTYYVRDCCDKTDILNLINNLNINAKYM